MLLGWASQVELYTQENKHSARAHAFARDLAIDFQGSHQVKCTLWWLWGEHSVMKSSK